MSPEITLEVYFLFHSFLMGIFITALYDILRILRRIIPHNMMVVSLEDLVYWVACSLAIFVVLIRENNGILRWFAVAGAMAGMFLYKKTLGFLIVKYVSLLLQQLLHLVGKVLKILLKPLHLVKCRLEFYVRASRGRLGSRRRVLRKRLTAGRKLLKMILYKR